MNIKENKNTANTKTIILHVGDTKTGSTSIQKTLFYEKNQELLAKKGYLFPKCWEPNHSVKMLSAFGSTPETLKRNIIIGFTKEEVTEYNYRNLNQLQKEIHNTNFKHLILSGELISSMKTNELKEMRDFLIEKVGSNQTQKQSISFRVILYIRNPKDHVSSRIQNIIRWGSDFQSAYQKVSDHLDHYYREKIEALQDTFGKNNIEVFQFEGAKKNKYGIAGHFLSLLDFTEKELSQIKFFRVNNRISKKAAEIISFINEKQPLIKNQKLSSGRFKEDTMPLFSLKGDKFDLTPEQKKNILTKALPDILWLKENLQIDYLNSQVFMNEMKNKNTMNFSYTKEDCRFLRKALKKTQPIIRRKIIAFFEDHLTPTRFSHIQQKVFVKKLKRVEKKISIKEKRRKRSKLHSLFTLIKDYLIIARSGLFDKKAYLKHYSDVKASNPIIHYIRHGASELRNPSNEFNTEYYLKLCVKVTA